MSELQLIEAVKAQEAEAIREQLQAGAEVNQQDEQGWTPLNWAAGIGNLELVRLLVEHGADVFKTGRDLRTPYLIALAAGHAEVVKFLRQAEDLAGGGAAASRPPRQYYAAYPLRELRRFPSWGQGASANGHGAVITNDQGMADEDIVFISQDYTVTKSLWDEPGIILANPTDAWKEFCSTQLHFKVPDDLDLMAAAADTGSYEAN